jgi:hypothetical protein
MAESKNKMGFLSSKYRSNTGMTTAQNIVLTQTIESEAAIYMKPQKVIVPTQEELTCKNSYLSFYNKTPVRPRHR